MATESRPSGLPRWVRPGATDTADRAWIERLRAMSFDDRAELLAQACELVRVMICSRPDRNIVLSFQEPLPADSAAVWNRLRARARGTAS